MSFRNLMPGDSVVRNLAGMPMPMKVVSNLNGVLECGAIQGDGSIFKGGWEFNADTGAEIDDMFDFTVSYLMLAH